MKQELTVRFAEIVDPQHALTLLPKIKQRLKESVQLFAERLLTLSEDAFDRGGAGALGTGNEQQLVAYFIDGLSDYHLKAKILRENPATFRAAVTCATNEQNGTERNKSAQILVDEIFPRFGCPCEVVTDNGTENENQVMKEMFAQLNVHRVTTSFYHPQSNAKVERFHRTLHDVLSKLLKDDSAVWDLYLNQALAVIRFNPNDSSKFSPFFLTYNRDVVLPTDNILKPRRKYLGEEQHKIAYNNNNTNCSLWYIIT